MGKKRSQRGGMSGEGDCDASSMASSTTFTSCRPDYDEEDDSAGQLEQALDNLLEKRRSTREEALRALLEQLRAEVRAEELAENQTTILGRCINLMRRGGEVEAALSAQLIALLIISLPEQNENNFLEAQFELQRSAASGASTDVRVAATEALAMACFVSAHDDVLRLEVMDRLRAVWAGGTPAAPAVAAALRGWGLLLTSLCSALPGATLKGALRQLAALLHAPSVEVRAAAGEVLALLYSQSGSGARGLLERLVDEDDEEYEQGEDDEDDGEASVAESVGSHAGAAPDPALLSRMRQLAVAHPCADPLRRSKRDRAAQRAAFRGILAAVERGGAVAPTKVKLQHGGQVVVDTLEGNVQLNAFRRALAGGFQVHLQSNPLLHAVFGFTPATGPPPRLTAAEKKATRSQNSADAKWRTADRKGGRAQKSMMMTMGGDDF